jgi:Winged helix DNA-binding domain
MSVRVSWSQVLAWRMKRQLLDPIGTLPVDGVVRRLGAVQAQVASSAELAVRVRRRTSRRGEVARALADGRLVKTWAMRGTLHLLTPDTGGAFLSLMAAGRSWERPSWVKYFGMTPKEMERLRGVVRDAIAERPLTREELIEAVGRKRGLKDVAEGLRSGWGTLLKPIAWQGDLVFGPNAGTRVTFTTPDAASARWSGLPDPDEAAPIAIHAYLGAYGPATVEGFSDWVAGGWFSKKRMRAWFADLGDALIEVDVDGERAWILAEHADELAATKPTSAVRLLPGFDQYVLGPGTKDGHVTPTARRADVSRTAGWIAPVVVAGGVVCGTWELDGSKVQIAWFKESGRVPRSALNAEARRLSDILGADVTPAVNAGE